MRVVHASVAAVPPVLEDRGLGSLAQRFVLARQLALARRASDANGEDEDGDEDVDDAEPEGTGHIDSESVRERETERDGWDNEKEKEELTLLSRVPRVEVRKDRTKLRGGKYPTISPPRHVRVPRRASLGVKLPRDGLAPAPGAREGAISQQR